MDTKSVIIGAAIATALVVGSGIGVSLATPQDAKTKLRELAPTIATHRIELSIDDLGVVRAAFHQHGVLTADAVAAGITAPGWVVDGVACNAAVLNPVSSQCPLLPADVAKIPFSFQP